MIVKLFEVNDYFADGTKTDRMVMFPKDANYKGSLKTDPVIDVLYKPITKMNVILRDEKGRFVSYKDLQKGLLTLKAEITKLPNCNW